VAYGALGTPIQGWPRSPASIPTFSRDGRQAIAGVLADRAVLGGVGLCRLERHEGRVAGHSGHRRLVRDPAIRDLELHQPWIVDIGCFLDLDGLPDLFLQVWRPRELWLSPALRGKDESAATMTTPKPLDKTPLTQSELWKCAAAVESSSAW